MILFLIFIWFHISISLLNAMEMVQKSFSDRGRTVHFENPAVAMSSFFVSSKVNKKKSLSRTVDYQSESFWGCALFSGSGPCGSEAAEILADGKIGLLPLLESDWNTKNWQEKVKNYNVVNFSASQFDKSNSTAIAAFLVSNKKEFVMAHWGHPFGLLLNGENGKIIHHTLIEDYSESTKEALQDNNDRQVYANEMQKLNSFGGFIRNDPPFAQSRELLKITPSDKCFKRQLEELPHKTIGVFFSQTIYKYFAKSRSQRDTVRFFQGLATILFSLKTLYPDSDLSQELFKLLGSVDSLDQALERVNNRKNLEQWDYKNNKFEECVGNTSLVVFEVEHNNQDIDADEIIITSDDLKERLKDLPEHDNCKNHSESGKDHAVSYSVRTHGGRGAVGSTNFKIALLY
jgi:hypothetical protein